MDFVLSNVMTLTEGDVAATANPVLSTIKREWATDPAPAHQSPPSAPANRGTVPLPFIVN